MCSWRGVWNIKTTMIAAESITGIRVLCKYAYMYRKSETKLHMSYDMVWANSLKFQKRIFDTFTDYPFTMLFILTVIMKRHTIQWLAGVFPSSVKWPEREAAHIPTPSGEVKNEWSCIFTTTVFMVCTATTVLHGWISEKPESLYCPTVWELRSGHRRTDQHGTQAMGPFAL
jgi:hypothetical protein